MGKHHLHLIFLRHGAFPEYTFRMNDIPRKLIFVNDDNRNFMGLFWPGETLPINSVKRKNFTQFSSLFVWFYNTQFEHIQLYQRRNLYFPVYQRQVNGGKRTSERNVMRSSCNRRMLHDEACRDFKHHRNWLFWKMLCRPYPIRIGNGFSHLYKSSVVLEISREFILKCAKRCTDFLQYTAFRTVERVKILDRFDTQIVSLKMGSDPRQSLFVNRSREIIEI